MRYIDILYVAGIPSEANAYWRQLRELKLLFQQFSYLFDDITWDLCISDFRISIGDDSVKLDPFIMEEFKIKREQFNDEDNVNWFIKQVRGSLLITESPGKTTTELPLCKPVDTTCQVKKKKRIPIGIQILLLKSRLGSRK